jgi:hypothetical protein
MKAAFLYTVTLYYRSGRFQFDLLVLLVFFSIFLMDREMTFEPAGAAIGFFMVVFGIFMTLRQMQARWLESIEVVVTRQSGRRGAFRATAAVLLVHLVIYSVGLLAAGMVYAGFFHEVSPWRYIQWAAAVLAALLVAVGWTLNFSAVFSDGRLSRRFTRQALGVGLAALGLAGVRWPGAVSSDFLPRLFQHILPPLMPLLHSGVTESSPLRVSGEIFYGLAYAALLFILARRQWHRLDLVQRPTGS